jgi:quercetin dioxygenase-like cupin family protein
MNYILPAMRYSFKFSLLLLTILIAGCKTEKASDKTTGQSVSIFAKGEKIDSKNFTGTVWLNMMGAVDSSMHVSYGNVSFEPKARTNWHSHPGGQILLITGGMGYYQALGEPARLLRSGDYMEIPPNLVHWHGAGPESKFVHIAISLNTDKGGAVWLQPVTEEEYRSIEHQ